MAKLQNAPGHTNCALKCQDTSIGTKLLCTA